MEDNKLVVFTLNEEQYGVDINRVQGIEREQEVVRIPNTVSYIKGIINLRGDIIPVYDLKEKFKIPNNTTQENQYIVVRVKDSKLALEVNGVREIHDTMKSTTFDMPAIVRSGDSNYFDKVISVDKSLIVSINVDNLLTDEEIEKIDEMVKQ